MRNLFQHPARSPKASGFGSLRVVRSESFGAQPKHLRRRNAATDRSPHVKAYDVCSSKVISVLADRPARDRAS